MQSTYKVSIGDVKFGKKTTIAIEIKGDLSDDKKLALLEFAQSDGFMQLATAQRDIGDYGVSGHEGLKFKTNGGDVVVDHEQLDIDTVIGDAAEEEQQQDPQETEPAEETEAKPEGEKLADSLEDDLPF